MNKNSYYDWIAENDSYPEHSHKWIVGLYNKYEGVEGLHRYFGVFETKEEAKEFAAEYREKYTKPGFISRTKIFPMCEVVEMSFRWMTPKDLSAAVRAQNILNSRVKRGEIEAPAHTAYVVCGCGEEGCGFISCIKKETDIANELEEQ